MPIIIQKQQLKEKGIFSQFENENSMNREQAPQMMNAIAMITETGALFVEENKVHVL